jgi:hypothetical protein
MVFKEVQTILDPAQEISFAEFSALPEVLVQAKLGIVIFLQETKEIENCAKELKRHLQGCRHETRLNHYQQFLFHGQEFFKQFGEYDLTPLVKPFSNQGVTIVTDFWDANETRMRQALAMIDQVPSGNKWVFLVPSWPATCPSPVFENWANQKELHRFRLGFKVGYRIPG